jgi:hypothetical protein
MRSLAFSTSVVAGLALGAVALAADYNQLPDDEAVTINGFHVACTGVGDESKSDPKWRDYSVRLEFAGGEQQYLADVDVRVESASGEELVSVTCGGPWILVDLEPGKYRVRASFERLSKAATFTAPSHGQKRVVVAFPEIVGDQ